MSLYFIRYIFNFLNGDPYFDLWTSVMVKLYAIGLKKAVYMTLIEYYYYSVVFIRTCKVTDWSQNSGFIEW